MKKKKTDHKSSVILKEGFIMCCLLNWTQWLNDTLFNMLSFSDAMMARWQSIKRRSSVQMIASFYAPINQFPAGKKSPQIRCSSAPPSQPIEHTLERSLRNLAIVGNLLPTLWPRTSSSNQNPHFSIDCSKSYNNSLDIINWRHHHLSYAFVSYSIRII